MFCLFIKTKLPLLEIVNFFGSRVHVYIYIYIDCHSLFCLCCLFSPLFFHRHCLVFQCPVLSGQNQAEDAHK